MCAVCCTCHLGAYLWAIGLDHNLGPFNSFVQSLISLFLTSVSNSSSRTGNKFRGSGVADVTETAVVNLVEGPICLVQRSPKWSVNILFDPEKMLAPGTTATLCR